MDRINLGLFAFSLFPPPPLPRPLQRKSGREKRTEKLQSSLRGSDAEVLWTVPRDLL